MREPTCCGLVLEPGLDAVGHPVGRLHRLHLELGVIGIREAAQGVHLATVHSITGLDPDGIGVDGSLRDASEAIVGVGHGVFGERSVHGGEPARARVPGGMTPGHTGTVLHFL